MNVSGLLKAALALCVVIVTPGCGGDESAPVRATATSSALEAESLRNATYTGILDVPVTLSAGRFEGEPFEPGGASRPVVTLVPGIIARGDLTGDGSAEAVVVLASNSGGSGVFPFLAVVQDADGRPGHIATVALDDRIKVAGLGIDGGILFADLVEHGPGDPMCCPSRSVRREWRLEDGELVQVEEQVASAVGRFSGHLVWGHESRSFTECDSGREGWVINESGDELIAVYEELTHAPYQPMFVELRGEWVAAPEDGFGADFDEALRVTELVRAENEGFGCRLDLREFLFAAVGNEPFWRLQVRDDGIELRTPEMPANRVFPPARRDGQPPLVVFDSADAEGTIRLSLQPRRCVDTMSGARYAWAAMVEVDGRRMQGCAAEGMQTMPRHPAVGGR